MSDITKPTPVAIVEKDPIIEEQERILLVDFTKACISGDLSKVKKQINTKKIRDIIVSKENNFYIAEAFNIACKKEKAKFVENFISNKEIMKLLENTIGPQIFEQACENGYTELVKLFTSKECILELDENTVEEACLISSINGNGDIINILLNNEKINSKMTGGKNTSSLIIGSVIVSNNIKPEIRKNIIMSILNDNEKKQLLNKDTLDKLFSSSCVFGEEEIFNKLLTDDELKNKIGANGAKSAISTSYNYNRTKFFEEILNNDSLRSKLIENYKDTMIDIFICACRDNKQEIINILKTNEEIKNKILPNTFEKACKEGNIRAIEELININGMLDKIKSSGSNVIQGCFQIACLNGKANIINRLLNNQNIKSEIRPEVIENCFKEACDNGKTNVINALIDNTNASINFNLKEQAVRECFTKACNSGETSIALELIENPKTKDIIFGIGNNINLNNFFKSLSQKENKLNENDLRLALLVVRAKRNESIETSVYDSKIKDVLIKNLITNLKINKNNFKSIKNKEGYKKFIEERKRESNYKNNWDDYKEKWEDNTPLQKTLLSLEKINKELLINKQRGVN